MYKNKKNMIRNQRPRRLTKRIESYYQTRNSEEEEEEEVIEEYVHSPKRKAVEIPSPPQRKTRSAPKLTTQTGTIEYDGKKESFQYQIEGEKGYHLDVVGKNGFSVDNFAVGNYIYFFVKPKSYLYSYNLLIKITPSLHKVEILDDTFVVYPSSSPVTYKRKEDSKYNGVDLLITSSRDNHLQLVFHDIVSNIPFCILNIQSS